MDTESALDELFQLPLDEFTAARNALAKTAGKEGAAIKQLTKPPLAAWAVNQLYWKDREHYDALTEAATAMRRTHKSVIEGKRADLRAAGAEHDAALDAALKATLAILKDSGNPVTDTTRQAILNTLRALPSDEGAGRLTRTLAPGGFEMLAGITPAAAPKEKRPAARTAGPASHPVRKDDKGADAKAAREREKKLAAERAVREADQRARHAEFEVARAARDATRAARRVAEARKALEEAQAELDSAEREASKADRAKEAADRRSAEAQATLDAARSKLLP